MPVAEQDKDLAAATPVPNSSDTSSNNAMPGVDRSQIDSPAPGPEPHDVSAVGMKAVSTVVKTRRIRAARTTQEMYSGLLSCHFDKVFYGETKKDQEVQYDTRTVGDFGVPNTPGSCECLATQRLPEIGNADSEFVDRRT